MSLAANTNEKAFSVDTTGPIPIKTPLQLVLRERPRTESAEASPSPGRSQPPRATSFVGQTRFSAPGLFVGGVAAGDAPEDQGFGVVAGALIDRPPHGAEFAGAVETRNGLAQGAHDAGLFVAARTALRVDKRGPEFERIVRTLFKRGRNERRVKGVGLRGLLDGTSEERVLPCADVFVPALHRRFEFFGRNLDGARQIGDRVGLLDVSVFSDRIEFLSFGELPPEADPELLRLCAPLCCNPEVACILSRLFTGGRYGLGLPEKISSYASYGLEPKITGVAHHASENLASTGEPRHIGTQDSGFSGVQRPLPAYGDSEPPWEVLRARDRRAQRPGEEESHSAGRGRATYAVSATLTRIGRPHHVRRLITTQKPF